MSSEATLEVAPWWVTPASGKGALGTRRFRELNTHPDSELDFMRG